MHQLRPLMVGEIPLFDFLTFKFRLGGNHPVDQLNAGHFKGEYRHGNFEVHGSIPQGGNNKRGLTHPWTSRDNDKIRLLPTRRNAVKCCESAWYAGQAILMVFQDLQLLDGTRHKVAHVVVVLPQVRVRYLEDSLFSSVK